MTCNIAVAATTPRRRPHKTTTLRSRWPKLARHRHLPSSPPTTKGKMSSAAYQRLNKQQPRAVSRRWLPARHPRRDLTPSRPLQRRSHRRAHPLFPRRACCCSRPLHLKLSNLPTLVQVLLERRCRSELEGFDSSPSKVRKRIYPARATLTTRTASTAAPPPV